MYTKNKTNAFNVQMASDECVQSTNLKHREAIRTIKITMALGIATVLFYISNKRVSILFILIKQI